MDIGLAYDSEEGKCMAGKFTNGKQERSYEPSRRVLRMEGVRPLYVKPTLDGYKCERDSRYAITSKEFHKAKPPK